MAKKHNAGAFLDLPPEASAYESARVVVLPMPLEESVSYGGGTAKGPEAILAASAQVELYDRHHHGEPALSYGVHTLPAPSCFGGKAGKAHTVPAMLDGVAEAVARHAGAGKFVLGLGGEHTASLGFARGVEKAFGGFTLVHVDAHADLRDSYQDNPLSHACVVRRIAELPGCESVLQLGIRSLCPEEAEFIRRHKDGDGEKPRIRTWFADSMRRKPAVWKREFAKAVKGRAVFFTFDVDGLDPSIVPATGTPEPDGLTWPQLMDIAGIIADKAQCLAMDCVELAPNPLLHYADFAVAKALYSMLNMFVR